MLSTAELAAKDRWCGTTDARTRNNNARMQPCVKDVLGAGLRDVGDTSVVVVWQFERPVMRVIYRRWRLPR